VQVNNTHGWHGARKLVRTNEQEKHKLLQKAKQRQQQQAMKRQQQNSGGGTRVLTLSPNPSGDRSGDDTKARTAPIEYCLRTCRLFSDTRELVNLLLAISPLLTRRSFEFVGPTVGEGQGCCEYA